MKILILHNKYRHRGGEDVVVDSESALLRSAGHQVRVEQVSNEDISGAVQKVRAFWSTPYDRARKKWFASLIARNRPDIVHIHNFFPLLTPAIHEAAAEMGVPVVQTLHNYRLLCANALFLRDGTVCERCISGNRYWGVVHRCYRGSLPGSLALVHMQNRGFRKNYWNKNVQRFIALTAFARDKFIAGGFPPNRIAIKPNFVVDDGHTQTERSGALFVGRLSKEKGGDVLIKAWRHLRNIPLTVVGDGPEFDALKKAAPGNVSFLGRQSSKQVRQQMRQAKMLIVPSICYEGFPMTVVEAFASGLPTLASKIGSLGEIVKPGVNGDHFAPGDADNLAFKARQLFDSPKMLEKLEAGARASYEEQYTPETNLVQLEDIYADAVEQAGRDRLEWR